MSFSHLLSNIFEPKETRAFLDTLFHVTKFNSLIYKETTRRNQAVGMRIKIIARNESYTLFRHTVEDTCHRNFFPRFCHLGMRSVIRR